MRSRHSWQRNGQNLGVVIRLITTLLGTIVMLLGNTVSESVSNRRTDFALRSLNPVTTTTFRAEASAASTTLTIRRLPMATCWIQNPANENVSVRPEPTVSR